MGGGGSFQGSSFESATLVRARLAGSFQVTNFSGARFEGADLSALDRDSLAFLRKAARRTPLRVLADDRERRLCVSRAERGIGALDELDFVGAHGR